MGACAAAKRLNGGGKDPSNRAIQSGYIYILRLPRWITITRVAAGR